MCCTRNDDGDDDGCWLASQCLLTDGGKRAKVPSPPALIPSDRVISTFIHMAIAAAAVFWINEWIGTGKRSGKIGIRLGIGGGGFSKRFSVNFCKFIFFKFFQIMRKKNVKFPDCLEADAGDGSGDLWRQKKIIQFWWKICRWEFMWILFCCLVVVARAQFGMEKIRTDQIEKSPPVAATYHHKQAPTTMRIMDDCIWRDWWVDG